MSDDDNLKWLMEQSFNSYLTWIGLWLVCLLGTVNILMVIVSLPTRFLTLTITQITVVLLMYVGLISGMAFSVYRTTDTLKEHVCWASKITNDAFRKQIFDSRGPLSQFVVDNHGKIRKLNRNIVIIVHFVVFFMFLGLALM